ncbi:MAG TPA: ABC transporter substrate-binding protein [Candidatus Binatia bacterium]|nr:ABC transporter substrate-binding protein [Candidatus Binatia bacterium]
MIRLLRIAMACTVLAASGSEASAQTPDASLTEIVFGTLGPTSSNWSLYLAEQQGYFRQEGLRITTVITSNPVNTLNQLATGGLNIASDGTDTVIAGVARKLPVKVVSTFMVGNPYAMVVTSGINSWNDLKGKKVGVGTKEDVTGMLMDAMARAHHFDMNRDFDLIVIGNTGARYQALTTGNIQGGFLGQPYDFLAESKGMHVLGRATEYFKDWMYTSVVVNTNWAATHRADVVKFIRALRKGTNYGYDHPQEAVQALVAASKVDVDAAQKAYALDFQAQKVFSRTGIVPEKGVRAVMDAMLHIGSITAAPPISDVVDNSYAQEAQR